MNTTRQRESVAVRTLLVSRDISAIESFCQSIQQLPIHVQTVCDIESASRRLCHDKFEGVIVDLAMGESALPFVTNIRELTSHKHAVICVITKSSEDAALAFRAKANFAFVRPLELATMMRTLRAAYPIMFRERRRSYRYPIEVPAAIDSGSISNAAAQSVNVSETGIAVQTSTPFMAGAKVRLRFSLPGIPQPLKVEGEVCWTDPSGRVGIRFSDLPDGLSDSLQQWLSERMAEVVTQR